MTRTTIDFGIDLGTTNSSIAVLNGTVPEVIQSQEPGQFGSVVTPSAIWFDKRGRQQVGLKARENYFMYVDWQPSPPVIGEDSGALEFKLRMGETWRKPFGFINRSFSPEEMSAEVLKTLRRDVQTAKGEDITAAVITVPAAFELPQCDATRRAAELAGFSLSPLLQEPVAAALAYGFQSAANKVFWLVYDFGGGTFDAAVIQVRDGVIQVVNHAGDNYLGGKSIDWDIVEKLLIPAIAREHGIDAGQLTRANREGRVRYLLNRLKRDAEEAKITVSTTRHSHMIAVDGLRLPGTNSEFDFAYELTPAAVKQIIEPWVVQSINLCKKALSEKGLSGRDIEKTILVGGSSLFPWLQERVAGELSTKLDFSIDPITVVARGAAVFAGTQRLDAEQGPVAAGTYKIEGLENFVPVGSEIDPLLVCRIVPPSGASATGLTIEIVETRSQWRSGATRLSSSGLLETEVHAEKGRKCEFQIILMDARGTRLSCSPDRFAYTVGMVPTSAPLTHNLGVALSNNKADWQFKKGDPLPGRRANVYHTIVPLRRNEPYHESNNVIRVPLIEGNNPRADRNRRLLAMEIRPDDPKVKRDVPLGSEIEVTISIDQSRTTHMTAFIPILDEEFVVKCDSKAMLRDAETLRQDLEVEVQRLEKLRERAESLDDRKGKATLAVLDNEQVVDQVKRKVAAAQGDPDARGEADKKLLDFRAAVDSVEDALEWPGLVEEARQQLESTSRAVNGEYGRTEERQRLPALKADVEGAIADERIELLRSLIDNLRDLGGRVIVRDPAFWVSYLQYLDERKGHMRDRAAAERLLAQGYRAIQVEPVDFDALKAAVRQLFALLPEQPAAEARGRFGSTIIEQ